jgi:cell division ATPase FtsA
MFSTSIGLLLNGYLLEKENDKQIVPKAVVNSTVDDEDNFEPKVEKIEENKKKDENLLNKLKDRFSNLFEDRDQKM